VSFSKTLSRLVKFEPGEGAVLSWAAACFFFILAGYYVIRPLRDEMGASAGGDALNWLFLGTLAGTLLMNPVFGALVSRFPRRVFVPAVYHFFAASFVVFYGVLSVLEGASRVNAARFFFIFASVFNLLIISVFWGFLADLFRPSQAKRLFGFIGLGGTLGGIAGGVLTASLAKPLGPVTLLLLAAALFEIAVFCSKRLVRLFGVDQAAAKTREGGEAAAEGIPPGTGALSGLKLFLKSPYLLGIAVFLLLFTIGSTFLYLEQARIVRATFHDSASRTAFFARADLAVNVLTALTQLFLTGRILPLVGLGPALALLPVITAGGFVALGLSPTAGTLFVVQVARRAAEFALVKPAREVLFTVVSREEKYSAKSFIDTFVYRSGDAVGAMADKLIVIAGIGRAGFAWAFLPVAALWVWNAFALGRRQRELASAIEPPPEAAVIIPA